MVEVKRIWASSALRPDEINRLLKQQSPKSAECEISPGEIHQAIGDPLFFVVAAVERAGGGEERWFGLGTMFVRRNLSRWIAEIHDVVVDEAVRGQGIGGNIMRELMRYALEFSRERGVTLHLFLTSRPSRSAANALYAKLGFERIAVADGEWGTNLFKIMVEPGGLRSLPP